MYVMETLKRERLECTKIYVVYVLVITKRASRYHSLYGVANVFFHVSFEHPYSEERNELIMSMFHLSEKDPLGTDSPHNVGL